MRILVIGGTGIVGTGIVNLLKEKHEVISVGHTRGDFQVDVKDEESIKELFEKVGEIDGIISTVGDGEMAPVLELKQKDFQFALETKLYGNVNIYKAAKKYLKENSFIIFTSGIVRSVGMPNTATLAVACSSVDALVRTLALEESDLRINAVSPAYVKETMELFGLDSFNGISAHDTAKVYEYIIENEMHGEIVDVVSFLKMV
ncbi:short chain dehydrogenase [Aureivirga sp. CE67]|uniref:short chain dehydrogenase n=1 Tax=Aureivirga sp. CE67 TaxID=1788983 RepID=UPI0018CA0AE6|nr:short chain dehydrogenase [Aureivirga sp. CE67]